MLELISSEEQTADYADDTDSRKDHAPKVSKL